MLGLLQRLAQAVTGRREDPYHPPHALPMVPVDRAIRELRAGLPVLLAADNAATALLIQGGEFASAASLDWLAQQADRPAELLLTPERARALGLTPAAAAVALDAEGLAAGQILALVDPLAGQKDTPALAAKRLLRGAAHPQAEAALQLAKLAELLPALAAAPLIFPDAAALDAWLSQSRVLPVAMADVAGYEVDRALSLRRVSEAHVPLEGNISTRIVTFRPLTGGLEHLAILIGEPEKQKHPVPIRMHSSCLTGDIFGSMRCDCGAQFTKAIHEIHSEGHGVVLYLNQEGRGIGIANKLKAYQLQDHGHDTFDANEMLGYAKDERRFCIAAQMLKELGVTRVRLMTNNPSKLEGLKQFGIEVTGRIAHEIAPNGVNDAYLRAKASKGGHLLKGKD